MTYYSYVRLCLCIKTMKPIYLFAGILVLALVALLMQRQTNVIVSDSPVKFSSVRKHPFDVYSDPYHPPERENPYWRGRDPNYQQVGVLQGQGRAGLLPLFGRPSITSNNRWEYYTMSDGLKLPVSYNRKQCNSDTGCDELIGEDSLDVLGLGKYKAAVYDVTQPRYDPGRL